MDSKTPLTEAIRDAALDQDGRLSLRCSDAFELARKLDVDLPEIRRVSDESNVKIVSCQLGCF